VQLFVVRQAILQSQLAAKNNLSGYQLAAFLFRENEYNGQDIQCHHREYEQADSRIFAQDQESTHRTPHHWGGLGRSG
jgi:hypothetical protein